MTNRVAFLANLRVGFEALRIHPLRTLLSVLGITIGSGALIATMAVSDGLMSFARETVRKQTSVQVIRISPKRSVYRDGQWEPIHDYPVFSTTDEQALRAFLGPGTAVTMVLGGRARVRYRGFDHGAQVTLGTAALPDFGGVDLAAGRFFGETEVAARAPVVVVNHALARDLSPGRDPLGFVGREIHVNGHRRRVIGVLAAERFEDRENPSFTVFAPIGAERALLDAPAGGRHAPSLQLLAPSVEAVWDVRDAATEWVSRRWGRWQDRVTVTVGLEQLEEVDQAFGVMKLFVGALVGISLLVGGIGIMNVLLASVAERTREIGIRKSVGARRGDISTQFLSEAVAIALAGAAAGIALGMAIAVLVTAVFRFALHVPVHAVLSPESLLLATLSSSAVGLAFGTYPARRAAELAPVVAIGADQ